MSLEALAQGIRSLPSEQLARFVVGLPDDVLAGLVRDMVGRAPDPGWLDYRATDTAEDHAPANSARRELEGVRCEFRHSVSLIAQRLGMKVDPDSSIGVVAKAAVDAAGELQRRSDELHRDLLREQRIVDALIAKQRGEMEAP